MSNKSMVLQECERANRARKVSAGTVTGEVFFQKIAGDLLMSGAHACDTKLLAQMIDIFIKKADMPTILLTSHSGLIEEVENMAAVEVFGEGRKAYHPLYGMSEQQICRLIRIACEELGCTDLMDRILLYTMALMEIVKVHYEVSLPAISQLLKLSDDAIAEIAMQEQFSEVLAGNISGNHEAGLLVRRIVDCLDKTFEHVAECGSETEKSLHKVGQAEMPHAAFYQYSQNQKLMNAYLKEELHLALRHNKKLRVIADEILVTEDDALLRFLSEMKRVGRIELIWCFENVRNVLSEEDMNFTNVCLFSHASVSAMEKVSEVLFGKYLFHYPVQTVGKPPSLIFTFKKDVHWTLHTEERLKVRAVDLLEEEPAIWGDSGEKLAVKIGQKDNIFLVSLKGFLKNR